MNSGHVQDGIRTKIVATIGPASASEEVLGGLLDAGVDVVRLNFSHGELSAHEQVLRLVREGSGRRGRPVAVLGDLCGPKIRLTRVDGGSFDLATGSTIEILRGDGLTTPTALYVTYPRLIDEVDAGHRIYIDDGQIRLLVIDRSPDRVRCACTVGGRISSSKGVNLPDTRLSAPALTDKDRRDLDWAMQAELDYVALSFVRKPEDLSELRAILRERQSDLGVIVKIEKSEALEHLEEFVNRSDGVMVARGDLGVEMDLWQVPLVQKSITALCRDAGKPVIIATQMLQSMVASPTPTRAEVSDVANAIFDGADAVMLSQETAAGQFPLAAVEIMQRVAQATEAYRGQSGLTPPTELVAVGSARTSAIARGAVEAARLLGARLVAVWTATGETVRQIARHRLPIPTVALTYQPRVMNKLALVHGVTPMLVRPLTNPVEMTQELEARLIESGLAAAGDLIIVVTSRRPTTPGETDTMLVHRIGEGSA